MRIPTDNAEQQGHAWGRLPAWEDDRKLLRQDISPDSTWRLLFGDISAKLDPLLIKSRTNRARGFQAEARLGHDLLSSAPLPMALQPFIVIEFC
jgi:hypothetical protein